MVIAGFLLILKGPRSEEKPRVIVGSNCFCSLINVFSGCAEVDWGIVELATGVVASECAPAWLFARCLPEEVQTLG